jgi:signal peptidase
MQPALRLGDIAILVPASPASIRVGEIVQYHNMNVTIIHRVVDTYTVGGSMWMVTKGDANSAPDEPVSVGQVTGKVVFVIPQLGWVSIALRTFCIAVFNYMANNLIVLSAALVALIPPSALLIHKRYNQPVRRIRRRLSR